MDPENYKVKTSLTKLKNGIRENVKYIHSFDEIILSHQHDTKS